MRLQRTLERTLEAWLVRPKECIPYSTVQYNSKLQQPPELCLHTTQPLSILFAHALSQRLLLSILLCDFFSEIIIHSDELTNRLVPRVRSQKRPSTANHPFVISFSRAKASVWLYLSSLHAGEYEGLALGE